MLVLMLALPASQGQDEKKPQSPKEQYTALVKEFNTQRQQIVAQVNKAKGDEQQKLIQKYYDLGKDFAEKFYKLAEDNAKDPAAADALFWVIQNGAGSPVYQKAGDKVTALVADMPLKDLAERLKMTRGSAPLMEAVLKRAEKDEADPQAGDLVGWVVTSGPTQPAGKKAAERLFEKYPNHSAVVQACQAVGRGPNGEATLKQLLEKDTAKPGVKAAAALALGETILSKSERTRDKAESDKADAEAEKYLVQAAELGKDNAAVKKGAERLLNVVRHLRVGKEAPEVKAPDLDGKEFKLSDYRGKVVLLDFWGHW
jgi:hypothetical protein